MATLKNTCLTWVLMLSFVSMGMSEIYIAPTGLAPWNGACDQAGCTRQSPCSLPGTEMAGSGSPCSITFLSGNYMPIFARWILPTNDNVILTFENSIHYLGLSVLLGGDLTMVGSNQSELFRNSITVSVNARTTIKISNISFVDSMVYNDGQSDVFEVSNCSFTGNTSTAGIGQTNNQPVTVKLNDIVIANPSTSSSGFITSYSNMSVIANRVSANIPLLVKLEGVTQALSVEIYNSTISLYYRLIQSTTPPTSLIIDESLLESLTNLGPLAGTDIQEVQVYRSRIYGVSIGVVYNFTSSHTKYFDCDWYNRDLYSLDLQNVGIYLLNGQPRFILESSQASPKFYFKDVAVHVGASLSAMNVFYTAGHVVMKPGSSLTTNLLKVANGSTFDIDTLTVTGSIAATGLQRGTLVTSELYVGSIDIDNLVLNMTSTEGVIHYSATKPENGIVSFRDGFIDDAKMIVISWQNSTAYQLDKWYPLANNMSALPSSVRLASDLQTDGIEFYTHFEPSSGTVSYRISRTIPCSPPPIGFVCVYGVWVADGTGNTTAEVVIPPFGGVVQVEGNLTVSGPIVFEGVGSSINVTGCFEAPLINIELNQDKLDLPKSPVTLIQQSGKGCLSLLDVPLNLVRTVESCEKPSLTKDKSSDASNLVIIFSVDSSKCSSKVWRWIVLGSVVGAVFLTAILAILVWKVVGVKHSSPISTRVRSL